MNKEQYSIANLPKTQKISEYGMAERLHIVAQRHVLIQGSIVADFALGHSGLGRMIWLVASILGLALKSRHQ